MRAIMNISDRIRGAGLREEDRRRGPKEIAHDPAVVEATWAKKERGRVSC